MNLPAKKNYGYLELNPSSASFNYRLEYEFFSNFESPHTRKSYRLDITQFFEFLKENFKEVKGYAEVERVHIVAFRNWLTDNNLAPKSINRKIAANSSFFDFFLVKFFIPRAILKTLVYRLYSGYLDGCFCITDNWYYSIKKSYKKTPAKF